MFDVVRLQRAFILVAAAFTASACLDRPVSVLTPTVSARVVINENSTSVSQIDLLFMIDNSSSMSDKQTFLQLAVPDLVKRLVDPVCVDAADKDVPGVAPDPMTGKCPLPYHRDFDPIRDIHVGIISSSLGGHGAQGVCESASDRRADPHDDDSGHLLTRASAGATSTFQNKGFLSWNPNLEGAESDADRLTSSFRSLISGVGQHGCGYESQLEAVYRFLNDPAPYQSLVLSDGRVVKQGIDQALLHERADFLRPDSLVAVISITDENDYSVVDGGQYWQVLAPSRNGSSPLRRPSSACRTNPNDPCCYNCGQDTVPVGCATPDSDPECKKNDFLSSAEDPENLRATRSKEQYGVDFLYPVERYVEGFTQPFLTKYGGGAKNPLYAEARAPSQVFWAGIVGVPWQDIARDRADLSKGFRNAKELAESHTWDVILGAPHASPPVLPSDPHMIVSPTPRAALPGPESAAQADEKHGHEWISSESKPADLQYACTFELPESRDCQTSTGDCDCTRSEAAGAEALSLTTKNPLCQDPATGAYDTIQRRAKGYPGLRELEVLQGIGEQGIVASICPSNTKNPDARDYGYRPAIEALVERLRGVLRYRCLPRMLAIADDGSVPCVILEAFAPEPGDTCRCDDPRFPGRVTPEQDRITDDVRKLDRCVCEIKELENEGRISCQKEVTPSEALDGWCYVDPNQDHDPRECAIVEKCPATDRRIIRYMGAQPRGQVVIMCQEKSFLANAATLGGDICSANKR
jgi:hypothetical protein